MADSTIAVTSTHTAEVHHEDPALKHQFDTPEQQYGASMFGMWIFLSTEIMMFGGLFLGYIVYRALYPQAWHEATLHQNWIIGGINTLVLITSSFTVALSIYGAQTNRNKLTIWCLLITILCAFLFLVNKYVEYSAHYHEGLLPGKWFNSEEYSRQTELFMLFYFVMTGLHGIHVLIGIGILSYMAYKAWKNTFHSGYYTPLEVAGLYWHFVDIVWIFLFPLLYLMGGVTFGGGH